MAEKLSDEIKKMDTEYEPLSPVEKKLISWSLIIGVVALAVLVIVTRFLMKAPH